MKVYSQNEFIRLLNDNGYQIEKGKNGGHSIYTNGIYRIAVPTHQSLSAVICHRIIKQYNLKEKE